jgi:hypothetical protein
MASTYLSIENMGLWSCPNYTDHFRELRDRKNGACKETRKAL